MSVLDSVHYDKVSGYAIRDFSLLSRRFSWVFYFFHRENKVIIYVKIPIFANFDHSLAENTSCRVIRLQIDKWHHGGTQIHYLFGIFDAEEHFFSKNRDISGWNWPF